MCWHPNDKQFYFAQHLKGLKVLDISNNKTTELLMPCVLKYYRTISCSPDGKKLIAERIDSRSEFSSEGKTTGNIINKSSVNLIDLQTLEESEVDLH